MIYAFIERIANQDNFMMHYLQNGQIEKIGPIYPFHTPYLFLLKLLLSS
jgi:hypothetical protein